jgi:hypothetical protein
MPRAITLAAAVALAFVVLAYRPTAIRPFNMRWGIFREDEATSSPLPFPYDHIQRENETHADAYDKDAPNSLPITVSTDDGSHFKDPDEDSNVLTATSTAVLGTHHSQTITDKGSKHGPTFSSPSSSSLPAPDIIIEDWAIPYDPSEGIPRQLFQMFPRLPILPEALTRPLTASPEVPMLVTRIRETWAKMNPFMSLHRYDDAMAEVYLGARLGADIAKRYREFPVGAMKSDFFRIAVIYFEGGVWADADVACVRPVEYWLPPPRPSQHLPLDAPSWTQEAYRQQDWDSCAFLAGLEWDPDYFNQWVSTFLLPLDIFYVLFMHACLVPLTINPLYEILKRFLQTFAAARGHPILRRALELILNLTAPANLERAIATDDNFVFHTTGPAVWTDAIKDVLSFPRDAGIAGSVLNLTFTDEAALEHARNGGVCLFDLEMFTAPNNIYHMAKSFGSWDPRMKSWREEEKLLRRAAEGRGFTVDEAGRVGTTKTAGGAMRAGGLARDGDREGIGGGGGVYDQFNADDDFTAADALMEWEQGRKAALIDVDEVQLATDLNQPKERGSEVPEYDIEAPAFG